MGVVIDSDILIELEKGRVSVEDIISKREDEEFFISVISVSELLHGVNRAKAPQTRMKRSSFVEGVIAAFPTLQIDQQTARMHSKIFSELIEKGKKPDLHDSWIAASCIAYGFTLITSNKRHFEVFPGLKLEIWPKEK
jgi:predicted nucleic acid-binding protein